VEYIRELINETNVYYGGKDLDVENVAFVNGEYDDWAKYGITTDLNEKSPAILIKGKLQLYIYV
jgi:hypothetical protein